MELVALLVVVAAGTMGDFPTANYMHLVLGRCIFVGVHRKRKVQLVADTLALAAHGSFSKLGDALVRVDADLLVLDYQQAGAVFRVGYESFVADALLLLTDGVFRSVRTICVAFAGCISSGNDGVARVLEHQKVVRTGTVVMDIVAVGKVIISNALFIDFAWISQRNGFTDTLFASSTWQESILTGTKLRFLIAV